jgi:hypothetical protein
MTLEELKEKLQESKHIVWDTIGIIEEEWVDGKQYHIFYTHGKYRTFVDAFGKGYYEPGYKHSSKENAYDKLCSYISDIYKDKLKERVKLSERTEIIIN